MFIIGTGIQVLIALTSSMYFLYFAGYSLFGSFFLQFLLIVNSSPPTSETKLGKSQTDSDTGYFPCYFTYCMSYTHFLHITGCFYCSDILLHQHCHGCRGFRAVGLSDQHRSWEVLCFGVVYQLCEGIVAWEGVMGGYYRRVPREGCRKKRTTQRVT